MTLIPVDGNIRLACTDCNQKGEKTVVFIHGWPLGRDIFEYQLDVLPRYGIRCVSIDLRGFGDSDKPWGGYNYDRMACDLHKVLTALDLRCCTLFGFSMGGAVCARYMACYGAKNRVAKLVLCGAACPKFTQGPNQPYGKTPAEVDALIGASYQDRPQTVAGFGRTCFASNPSNEFMTWINSICNKAAGYSTAKSLVALRDEDLTFDLQKIGVPTAIFHGLYDEVCPYQFAGQMNALIKNSFVVTFEHSGHALFYDEKEKCNTHLLEFINS